MPAIYKRTLVHLHVMEQSMYMHILNGLHEYARLASWHASMSKWGSHACLECVGTQSISHAVHACMACCMCEGGISEENRQGKCIQNLWKACAGFFLNMGFAPGVLNRQCNCRTWKHAKADLSKVFGWNQQCQRIFTCGCDVSGSWSLLPKQWIAGWLRIHEKVIKHVKWRHTHGQNRS